MMETQRFETALCVCGYARSTREGSAFRASWARSVASASSLAVTSPLFLLSVVVESAQSIAVISMQFDDLLPASANTSPAAQKGDFVKKRRLDRQGIETRHVAGGIDAVKQQRGCIGHGAKAGAGRPTRPTHSMNQLQRIDSCG